MTVGDRIKSAREAIGMTQSELGKICGVTKQTIFKYENNIITNIPLDKLKLISIALNVSAAKLMDWETDDGGIDIGLAQLETGLSEHEVIDLVDTSSANRKIDDSDLMFALWGDTDEVTEEDLEDVKRYAAFVRERKQKK